MEILVMETVEIFNELRTFIANELLDGQNSGLDMTTPLLEWGIIDSLAMVSLISFVEKRFQVTVPDEAVRPKNFENLQALTEMLAGLLTELEVKNGNADKQDKHNTTTTTGTMVQIVSIYGVKSDVVELPNSTQHIMRVSGNRPTWVLLPPLGNPATSWGGLMRLLVDDQEILTVDMMGFGLSTSNKTEAPTFLDHLEETINLLEVAVQPQLILCGSSLGALLATEIARQRPEWVKALVIIGFGLVEDPAAWWQRFQDISQNITQFFEQTYHQAPAVVEPLHELLTYAFTRPAYDSFLDAHGLAAMEKAFDNLNIPVLFIFGEDDRIISRSAIEAAAARIPGARVEMLARCGHFPQIERPNELLTLVQNFLKPLSVSD
jgi:2-hydroxymuconate-semialdehyde hydrolase